MKDLIPLFLLSLVFFVFILLCAHVWGSQVIVQKSMSTGEIVSIIGSDTMPDKYVLEWVK